MFTSLFFRAFLCVCTNHSFILELSSKSEIFLLNNFESNMYSLIIFYPLEISFWPALASCSILDC